MNRAFPLTTLYDKLDPDSGRLTDCPFTKSGNKAIVNITERKYTIEIIKTTIEYI